MPIALRKKVRRPYGDWHSRWLAGFCWGACIAVCIGMFWGMLAFCIAVFQLRVLHSQHPRTRMAGGFPDFTRPAVFLSARFVCEVFDNFFGADGHPLRAVSRVSSSGKSAGRTRPLSNNGRCPNRRSEWGISHPATQDRNARARAYAEAGKSLSLPLSVRTLSASVSSTSRLDLSAAV